MKRNYQEYLNKYCLITLNNNLVMQGYLIKIQKSRFKTILIFDSYKGYIVLNIKDIKELKIK